MCLPSDGRWRLYDQTDRCESDIMLIENYMRQAFYPLTLPLTVGPGSIAGLLIGALVIAVSNYLSYSFAEGIGWRWVTLR